MRPLAGGHMTTSREAPEGFKCTWCDEYPYKACHHKTAAGKFTSEHRMLSLMQEAYENEQLRMAGGDFHQARANMEGITREPIHSDIESMKGMWETEQTCECGSGSNAIGPGHSDWCRRYLP